MDGSGTGEVNLEAGRYSFRIGDELRGERVTLGKSLLDVQRDLRIKASFIAAIEDCDATAFPNAGVVPGFVRCYARYLQLDPDEVYRRFCEDSGFEGTKRPAALPPERARKVPAGEAAAPGMRMEFPLAQKQPRELPSIPLAAIGSTLVLIGLIVGLGYGGWSVLQNIQRVQFAPVEEIPIALAEVAPLAPPEPSAGPSLPEFAVPVTATTLAELYRQQELEVPILQPRDGPIAAIDPDRVGLVARRNARPDVAAAMAADDPSRSGMVPRVTPALVEGAGEPEDLVEVSAAGLSGEETASDASPRIIVIAERPAWIRVYLRNGTVIFERILETGEVYAVPETDEAPLIWAGNSGSVYVRIDDALHGPIGRGTRAARDIPLDPAAITERFEVVADVPGVIADTIGTMGQPADVLVQ